MQEGVQEKLEEKAKEVYAKYAERAVNSNIENFKGITSIQELRKAVRNLDEDSRPFISDILNKLEEEDNDDLKSIIK
jgi:hypothetical protein